MNFHPMKRACVALALIVPAASASAAIVTINHTVDLSTLNFVGGYVFQEYANPTFALNVGDTLKLNYDFLGSQTLVMNTPGQIKAWGIASDGCHDFNSTGSMKLVNATGPAIDANGDVENGGCNYFGNLFQANQFTSGPGAIAFSGMQFTMTVNAYTNDITTRDYNGIGFNFYGGDMVIGSEVPEPASLGLFGLGLAALLRSRLRRRA